ncbi:maleylpyruvate isomerase family mycothiol-dependent enzyme [Tessaracoccus terricola]
MKFTTVWPVVHEERRLLVADLEGLTDDQWVTPSLCPAWDVHDVVAHLVDTARTGRLGFVRALVEARMDFDRANENGIAREKRPDPRETLAALREAVQLTLSPPVSLATRLVEAIVHGEDIRRPLGMVGHYPDDAISEALAHQLRTTVSFGGGKERAAGLCLVDRRSGDAWGDGAVVEGEAIDLLLAVSGRRVESERFSCDGAARFVATLAGQL